MKTLTQTITAAAVATSFTALNASANERVVVLADIMPEQHARTVLAQTKRIMADMKPGDTLTFWDGQSAREIAQIVLPDGAKGAEILNSKRKKSKLFGQPLKSVQDFIVTAAKTSVGPNELALQANLPGALQALSLKADLKPDVIVFGSMRYHDEEKSPGYSMANKFPNDAHVFQPPTTTPYGAAGMEGVLEGTHVHFCHMDTQELKTVHTLGLERATGLLVQGYGATFATASNNVAGCVSHALEGKVDPTKAYTADRTQTRLLAYDVNHTAQAPNVDPIEQQDMFSRITLPQDQKDVLAKMMAANKVVLAEVLLFDTHSTDGDVVALVSGDVEFTVALTKTKKKVIVPITNNSLKIRGVRDGNGGITVGVETSKGDKLISPVMKVGQTITLPFLKLQARNS